MSGINIMNADDRSVPYGLIPVLATAGLNSVVGCAVRTIGPVMTMEFGAHGAPYVS